jgi:hypothetical protein
LPADCSLVKINDTGYTIFMGRPKAKDGVRARIQKDGAFAVCLSEFPGHWIVSGKKDRDAAIQ